MTHAQLNAFYNDNVGLIYDAPRILGDEWPQFEFQDFIDAGNDVFVRCAKAFNPEKGEFSTLLYSSIINRLRTIHNHRNRAMRKGVEVPILRTMPDGSEHEYIADTNNSNHLSMEFMDRVASLPDDMRRVVLFCLDYDNIKKYGLNTGSRNGGGIVYEACNRKVWNTRMLLRLIKGWLSGREISELRKIELQKKADKSESEIKRKTEKKLCQSKK